MRPNYLVIPVVAVLTAAAGSNLTGAGMAWYRSLRLPPWIPPGATIGMIWTAIYVLATISALIVWNRKLSAEHRKAVGLTFLLNAFLKHCGATSSSRCTGSAQRYSRLCSYFCP